MYISNILGQEEGSGPFQIHRALSFVSTHGMWYVIRRKICIGRGEIIIVNKWKLKRYLFLYSFQDRVLWYIAAQLETGYSKFYDNTGVIGSQYVISKDMGDSSSQLYRYINRGRSQTVGYIWYPYMYMNIVGK